jgi:hypothetical protein
MSGSSQALTLRSPLHRITTRLHADDGADPEAPARAEAAREADPTPGSSHASSSGARSLRFIVAAKRPARHLSLAVLAASVAACTATGDFGRPAPSVWTNVLLPAIGDVAVRERGGAVSSFPLTDLEEELRNRSWRFLMPAYDRGWFDRLVADFTRTRVLPANAFPSDRTAYYRALVGDPFASPASRFRRIGEDAEADRLLIDPFGEVAARVIAADRARLRGLAYMRDLSADEVGEASARVIENRCLIAWVRSELQFRTESYRYALEHAFLAMPQDQAIEAEGDVRALDLYRRRLDGLPVPGWLHGECVTAAVEPLPRPKKPLVVKD